MKDSDKNHQVKKNHIHKLLFVLKDKKRNKNEN
jgi:hypothetical protein